MRLDTTVDPLGLDLDERLTAELDLAVADASRPPTTRFDLSASVADEHGELLGGISGWTLGTAAGITLLWLRADRPGSETRTALLGAFEDEARRRGATQVLTTSSTLAEHAADVATAGRHGYRPAFPVDAERHGGADVHLRKRL